MFPGAVYPFNDTGDFSLPSFANRPVNSGYAEGQTSLSRPQSDSWFDARALATLPWRYCSGKPLSITSLTFSIR